MGEDKDIAVDKLKGKAQRAMELAQVFGGKGLPLFESPEQVTFGDEHAEGAKEYIDKMVGGLKDVLPHAVRVVLSTYDLGLTAKQEDLELEGATRIEPPKPKEGSGASRDPDTKVGPPKWDGAKFDVGGEGATVQVSIKYP